MRSILVREEFLARNSRSLGGSFGAICKLQRYSCAISPIPNGRPDSVHASRSVGDTASRCWEYSVVSSIISIAYHSLMDRTDILCIAILQILTIGIGLQISSHLGAIDEL